MEKNKTNESAYSFPLQPESMCTRCKTRIQFGKQFGVAQGLPFHKECCNTVCSAVCRYNDGKNCYRCLKKEEDKQSGK